MNTLSSSAKAADYLRRLCLDIPNRRVGSAGNRAATDFFAQTVAAFGFEIEVPEFECMDWSSSGVQLTINGVPFAAFSSPYALGCRLRAPFTVISTVEALEAAEISDKVILRCGEIAKEQLLPKNFPFYNPDEHKRIIELLETKQPQAIIAATARDVQMAGSLYPFPLIEDGDFDIPSVYMTDVEGNRLLEYLGQEISLHSRAKRLPATGCNVIARKVAQAARRVVLFAHIDAKIGTPGAIDNASGVIVLLLLAELLADYAGQVGIELVALNGEDYYSSPGAGHHSGARGGFRASATMNYQGLLLPLKRHILPEHLQFSPDDCALIQAQDGLLQVALHQRQ